MKSVHMGLLVAIAAAAFAAACTSSSPPQATPAAATATTAVATPTATPAPSATALKAAEDGEKYSFDPSTRTVAAGAITITFINQGTKPHNFAIKNPAGGADLFKSDDVAGGKSADFKLTIPNAGTYEVYSTVQGDSGKGLVGKIIVVKN